MELGLLEADDSVPFAVVCIRSDRMTGEDVSDVTVAGVPEITAATDFFMVVLGE